MAHPNPFQSFAHCWRFAERRAFAEGEAYHVIASGPWLIRRIVLSDRELFSRADLAPEQIEATADPFLPTSDHAGSE